MSDDNTSVIAFRITPASGALLDDLQARLGLASRGDVLWKGLQCLEAIMQHGGRFWIEDKGVLQGLTLKERDAQ